jgi:hypothetical protein
VRVVVLQGQGAVLLWLAALLLLLPSTNNLLLLADVAGFALGALLIAWESKHKHTPLKPATVTNAITP